MTNTEKMIQVRDTAKKAMLKLQAENYMLNMDLWAARRGYPYVVDEDLNVTIIETHTMEG